MTSVLSGTRCIEKSPARILAGSLAHLARYMETGCTRAGRLAALLLDQVAIDADADAHLRTHARELVDILERDARLNPIAAIDSLARGLSAPRKALAMTHARP